MVEAKTKLAETEPVGGDVSSGVRGGAASQRPRSARSEQRSVGPPAKPAWPPAFLPSFRSAAAPRCQTPSVPSSVPPLPLLGVPATCFLRSTSGRRSSAWFVLVSRRGNSNSTQFPRFSPLACLPRSAGTRLQRAVGRLGGKEPREKYYTVRSSLRLCTVEYSGGVTTRADYLLLSTGPPLYGTGTHCTRYNTRTPH